MNRVRSRKLWLRAASAEEAVGEDVRVNRHDRQVRLRPQCDQGAGNAVVDSQLVAERQVKASVHSLAQQVGWPPTRQRKGAGPGPSRCSRGNRTDDGWMP